jgi:hypothetical protein
MCGGYLTIDKLIVVFFEFSCEIYQGQLTGIAGFGKHAFTTKYLSNINAVEPTYKFGAVPNLHGMCMTLLV